MIVTKFVPLFTTFMVAISLPLPLNAETGTKNESSKEFSYEDIQRELSELASYPEENEADDIHSIEPFCIEKIITAIDVSNKPAVITFSKIFLYGFLNFVVDEERSRDGVVVLTSNTYRVESFVKISRNRLHGYGNFVVRSTGFSITCNVARLHENGPINLSNLKLNEEAIPKIRLRWKGRTVKEKILMFISRTKPLTKKKFLADLYGLLKPHLEMHITETLNDNLASLKIINNLGFRLNDDPM